MNMSQGEIATTRKLPWPAWLCGGLFALYGAAAAFDHVMSLWQAERYYRASGMDEAQVIYFSGLPGWAVAAWTLSVWGGLLGAIALLLRRRASGALFAASAAGGLAFAVYTLGLSPGRGAMGALWPMPIIVTATTAAVALYARRLAKRGVLR